jgi:hypothetical protein
LDPGPKLARLLQAILTHDPVQTVHPPPAPRRTTFRHR